MASSILPREARKTAVVAIIIVTQVIALFTRWSDVWAMKSLTECPCNIGVIMAHLRQAIVCAGLN